MAEAPIQVAAATKADFAVAAHHLPSTREAAGLADMIADTERLGLYDAVPEDVRAAVRAARTQDRALPSGENVIMTQPATLRMTMTWRRVRSNAYPWAARIDGTWHVLRLNDFPDHPLHTLFVDGGCVGDLDDLPESWHLDGRGQGEPLTPQERQQVLTLMRGLGPYGSEAGRPCDGDFCTCDIMTDDWAARETE